MKSTPNYNLVKQELTDAADITQISGNWDKLDTTLKNLDDNKFNKTGGTISGQVTVTGRGNFYSVQVTDTETVGGTLTVGGKVTANGGLGVSGGATVDSLTATGDVTVNGKINTDNIRARGTALNAGVTMSESDFVGVIAQVVSGTTPRISVSHHPDKTSNDKQIATTNWVKSLTATTSEYGLVKVADETALLSESDDAALTVDKAYELNDFRRMSTAYAVGDKVNCAFNFGLFLECTKAGTTGATTLDTRSVTHGQVITDGTVQWTVRTHVKSVNGNVADATGNITVTVSQPVIASQSEAEAGTDNTKFMTPLRTKQAIDALAQAFPSGTQLLFYQTNAPTGWTKVTGIGNSVVHIVEDATGGYSGGSLNFADVFKSLNTNSVTAGGSISSTSTGGTVGSTSTGGTVGSTALRVEDLPSHKHSINTAHSNAGGRGRLDEHASSGGTVSTNATGSGWEHSHSFSGSSHSHTFRGYSHTHNFSGSSHNHTVDLSVKYINVIVCKKD